MKPAGVRVTMAYMLLGGCGTSDNVTTKSSVLELTTDDDRPGESQLLQLSSIVPSFAGYYCDAGNLKVGLTSPRTDGDDELIVGIVTALNIPFYCYSRSIGAVTPRAIVVEKSWSFAQLRAMRDSIADEFFETGGFNLAIDYAAENARSTGGS